MRACVLRACVTWECPPPAPEHMYMYMYMYTHIHALSAPLPHPTYHGLAPGAA